MALRRLSGDCESGDWTCPSVWEDDEISLWCHRRG